MECLACIVILGTAVVSGLSLVSVQSDVVVRADLEIAATRLLTQEFEKLQSMHYDAIEAVEEAAVDRDSRFLMSRAVVEQSDAYKTVTITIRWTPETGVVRSETLTTLRCLEGADQ